MTFTSIREPRIPARASRRGFTLTEVMVSMTILMLAMSLTLVAFLAALRATAHTERALRGVAELRLAADMISESARSASQTPTVQAAGRQLFVPPKDAGFATVQETTWIDSVHDVKGSKSNQKMIKVSNATPSAVTMSVFKSGARPAGSIGAGEVSTYFKDASSLPETDLADLFQVGDSVTIPATAYGPSVTRVINSISNNPGTKTLTFTANLGVDVPNGTKLAASSGRRLLFSVESNGDLRFYPDSRNLSQYSILARDIDPAPRSVPADTTSAHTVPFVLSGRYLTLNLQKLPRGSTAGRTVQGVQTTVLTRTDPLNP